MWCPAFLLRCGFLSAWSFSLGIDAGHVDQATSPKEGNEHEKYDNNEETGLHAGKVRSRWLHTSSVFVRIYE